MAVLLFHYTTRYTELYGGNGEPTIAIPHGHYGVNLFFVISGFVIFMTIKRTRKAMDFVVSRFSRLFPSYWVAVALTFIVVSWAGLPGKEVTATQALTNGLMFHGLLGIPHVDSVYWTLEIELFFYGWMLLLWVSGQLRRIHQVLWAMLGLRVLYHVAATTFDLHLSWTLSHLLILKYLPWFGLGICVYQWIHDRGPTQALLITLVAALFALAVVDGWRSGLLGASFALLVWLAASGRAPVLGNKALVLLGAISYPLYLTHENIGWVAERTLQGLGLSFDASVLITTGGAMALAALLTYSVERPAMRVVRRWYARRSSDSSAGPAVATPSE